MTARLRKIADPSAEGARGRALLDGVQTAAWVVVITLLVWVYADLEFTGTRDVSATLRIRTASEDKAVVLGPTDLTLNFRVRGNRYSIDRFLERMSSAGSALTFDASSLEPGLHRLRTVDVLSRQPEIRPFGLEVVSAQQDTVEIRLDTLKLVPGVPVRFEYAGAVVDGRCKLEPEKVDLRVPTTQVPRLGTDLAVKTETLDLRETPAEEQVTRSVELLPPTGLTGVRLSPPRVSVTFKVAQPTASRKFTVPIKVQSPKAWLEDDTWAKLKLQAKDPEDWTREIAVLGNRIDLDKLRAEDISAYVTLTEDDKQRVNLGSWWPGQIRVEFPAGLKVRLGEPPPPISYRLTKRAEGPPATP